MIHRKKNAGPKLDVAGLNEITVLIDRSETELTEVAMNAWAPGLDGPPHKHDRKEQNFLVTAGRGRVKVGHETFAAAPGAFFYLPAGVVHQTITEGEERLVYFLFNAFLDADKEGHASFAEHIEKVKHVRKAQAEAQSSTAGGGEASAAPPPRPGKFVDTASLKGASTPLLTAGPTERCEAMHHHFPAGHTEQIPASDRKEQTIYVQEGSATFRAGEQQIVAEAGDVVFIRRGEAAELTVGERGFRAVSCGTVVAR